MWFWMKVVDHFKKKNYYLKHLVVNLCIENVCMHTLPGVRPFLMSDGWVFPFFSSVVQSLVKFNDSLPQCQCILSEYHKRYNCLLHFLLKSLRLDILIYKMTMISNRHLFPKLLFPSMFYVVLQKLALWSSRLLESEVQDIWQKCDSKFLNWLLLLITFQNISCWYCVVFRNWKPAFLSVLQTQNLYEWEVADTGWPHLTWSLNYLVFLIFLYTHTMYL